jgi:hypothetical protein
LGINAIDEDRSRGGEWVLKDLVQKIHSVQHNYRKVASCEFSGLFLRRHG